jgi:alpha-aminoadipate/glutamate carrier protein LysW
MVSCPACEADLDLDEEQLLEGGVVSCAGCGAHFEVVNPHPLELQRFGADDDDLDDDDDDEDEDEDDEDDEDEDEEEAGYDDEDDTLADPESDDE